MNWEAIGAIGEIVGAVAVVATLFYLAAQIRQSTGAARSAAADSWSAALQKTNELQLANEHTMDVWHRGGFMRQELTGQDLSTFKTLASAAINAVEKLYIEHLKENVDVATWESAENTLKWVLFSPAGEATWQDWLDGNLGDPRFRKFVSDIMKDYSSSPADDS